MKTGTKLNIGSRSLLSGLRHESSRDERINPRSDLVGDRADLFGHLLESDLGVALPANQDDFVIDLRANVGHVEHRHIHSDTPDYRCRLAMD